MKLIRSLDNDRFGYWSRIRIGGSIRFLGGLSTYYGALGNVILSGNITVPFRHFQGIIIELKDI